MTSTNTARHLALVPGGLEDLTHGKDVRPSLGFHVLLVDDGPFSRRLTRLRLERAGLQVSYAEDALGPVDIIVCSLPLFLDIAPPEGAGPTPVVVFTPVDVSADDVERADAAGAFTIVPLDQVEDAVLEALWETNRTASASR